MFLPRIEPDEGFSLRYAAPPVEGHIVVAHTYIGGQSIPVVAHEDIRGNILFAFDFVPSLRAGDTISFGFVYNIA